MFKVVGTIIFVVFGVLAIQAVWNLGFGWTGVVVGALTTLLLVTEMWYTQPNQEARTNEIVRSIEGFKGEAVQAPSNLQDAKQTIAMLKEDRELLSTAYIDLLRQCEITKEIQDV